MKRTWQPKKLKRKRKHGFLESNRKRKTIIAARRKKGRWKLTV